MIWERFESMYLGCPNEPNQVAIRLTTYEHKMDALVLHQDNCIEEEMLLRIGDVEVLVFTVSWGGHSFFGTTLYKVELLAVCLDDSRVWILEAAKEALERLGDDSYRICGQLQGENIHCLGLLIDVSDFEIEYIADGSYISLHADRIGVEFL